MQHIYETWMFIDTCSNRLKSEFENYFIHFNPVKSTMSISYDLYGTSTQQDLSQITLNKSVLKATTDELEQFQNQLDSLKNNLNSAVYLADNTFYNSYSLLLDRFWSNLKILNEIYENSSPMNTSMLHSNDQENQSPISTNELILNNFDFQSEDSLLDQANFQFELRSDQLSTPRINSSKSYSDKSVATIEEKSSQTDFTSKQKIMVFFL